MYKLEQWVVCIIGLVFESNPKQLNYEKELVPIPEPCIAASEQTQGHKIWAAHCTWIFYRRESESESELVQFGALREVQ